MDRVPRFVRDAVRFTASLPRRFWSRPAWERAVAIACAIYAVSFSILTVAKFQALHTYAWDLGVYSQATYTAAYSGRFFYYTVDLPNNPGGSIFGAHFSPILFAVVPFLWVSGSPATLLVLQSIALGGGGFLVYHLARLRLPERFAGLFAIAYLLDPALQGVNWYDFHPEAFFVPIVLLAIYLWERRSWRGFAFALVLALSTLESTGFMVVGLGLFWLLSTLSLREPGAWLRKRETRIAAGACVLGVAWTLAGFSIVAAFNPGLAAQPVLVWMRLGATSIGDVPLKMLTNPSGLVASLAFDAGPKLIYLLLLFGPVGFLLLRRPLTLLMVAPWLAPALTSSGPSFYQIGTQYPSLVLAFLFYGAILGAERIITSRPGPQPHAPNPDPRSAPSRVRVQGVLVGLAALALVICPIASPLGPLRLGNLDTGGWPAFTSHTTVIHELVALVPAGAPILTQNNLFPFFTDRAASYVVPGSSAFRPGATFNSTLDGYLASVDYVLVDFTTSPVEAAAVLLRPAIPAAFGLLGWDDGGLLLRRGYVGTPVLQGGSGATFTASGLTLVAGRPVGDASSVSGTVLYHAPGLGPGFWDGPGILLWPGVYHVTFRLRTDAPYAATALTVAAEVRPYAVQVLLEGSGSTGSNAGLVAVPSGCVVSLAALGVSGTSPAYADYSFDFRADVFGLYSFPGSQAANETGIYLDRILLELAVPLAALRAPPCP